MVFAEKIVQKYGFEITVKYKALTLKEAAEKEERIREFFKDEDATVWIKFDQQCPSCGGNLYWGNSTLLPTTN